MPHCTIPVVCLQLAHIFTRKIKTNKNHLIKFSSNHPIWRSYQFSTGTPTDSRRTCHLIKEKPHLITCAPPGISSSPPAISFLTGQEGPSPTCTGGTLQYSRNSFSSTACAPGLLKSKALLCSVSPIHFPQILGDWRLMFVVEISLVDSLPHLFAQLCLQEGWELPLPRCKVWLVSSRDWGRVKVPNA